MRKATFIGNRIGFPGQDHPNGVVHPGDNPPTVRVMSRLGRDQRPARAPTMPGRERPAISRKAAAMTEEELTIGAEASCSDGACGKVSRLVIHPVTRAVTHLVVEPRHRRDLGRLVPLRLVDATTDHIRLRCTLAEFGTLDPAKETDIVDTGDVGAEAVSGFGYAGGMGVDRYGMGMGVDTGRGYANPVVVHDVIPQGETDLRRGEHVHALDGEIGQVAGFLVDPGNDRVTHVLLQEGHLWGRKEVSIPISAVTTVDDGIRLNITKKQVADLPPAN